jgi:membrane-bound lytic murein transglycosylase A
MNRVTCALVFALIACSGSDEASPPPSQPNPAPAPTTAAAPPQDCDGPTCPQPEPPVLLECDEDPELEAMVTTGDEKLSLKSVSYADLPGWGDDQQSAALTAFLSSCAVIDKMKNNDRMGSGPFGGKVKHWRPACKAAKKVAEGDDAAARAFFESKFAPYAAHGGDGPVGKMTGYYVQELNGSLERGGNYQFPLYKRPSELVEVQLSNFIRDGRSRRIWGQIEPGTGKMIDMLPRKEFRQKAGDDGVLLWVDDPKDAIGIEIEGSGRALMKDGSIAWVAFAGKNGIRSRRSRGISKAFKKMSKKRGDGDWTKANVKRYWELIDKKDGIVFFEFETRPGAIGTQDVVLTGGRSLAVDRAVISLSTPIWVSTKAPKKVGGGAKKWERLLVAQDTGGNILGSVRGDIYFGDDRDAAWIGGRVNNPGQMWLLIPKTITVAQ